MNKTSYGHPDNYMSKGVAKYPRYFAELAQGLPKGSTVLDLFGGVGLLAHELWPVLEPVHWVSWDTDASLADKQLEPKVQFYNYDAFSYDRDTFDLVIIDPERCTLNQIMTEPKWERLLLGLNCKHVLMQEYGAYWCHLPNQIPIYEKLSGGRRITRANYPELFAEKMMSCFDLKVLKNTQGLGSTYYLMERV